MIRSQDILLNDILMHLNGLPKRQQTTTKTVTSIKCVREPKFKLNYLKMYFLICQHRFIVAENIYI